MKTVESIADLGNARKSLKGKVGLVPTMGFLHEGHLSLVKLACEASQSVVASIFVNPSQFGPGGDLDSYPRDTHNDLKLLEEAGVDLVWLPTPEIMYPQGYQSWVEVENITQMLEGAKRPGHFRGVSTIVSKLFNAVQPDLAVFGQKDAQQVAVIRRMVLDLNFPIEIIVGPIIREEDGLAKSSRNIYLNDSERKAATVLRRALSAAKKAYEKGERSGDALRDLMTALIETEPLARLEYVACSDVQKLTELDDINAGALLSMAVFIGKTRLIDNVVLEKD